MLEIITVLCLVSTLIVLTLLSLIDLKEKILPNELVLGFMTLGIVFHISTVFSILSFQDMAFGALIGFGALYFIRTLANMAYNQDTLGLGDVKLLGAAGIWLGPYHILIAMALGALMGVFHGLAVAFYIRKKTGNFPNLNMLSLPAGPGFAMGIVVTGVLKFWTLPAMLMP